MVGKCERITFFTMDVIVFWLSLIPQIKVTYKSVRNDHLVSKSMKEIKNYVQVIVYDYCTRVVDIHKLKIHY